MTREKQRPDPPQLRVVSDGPPGAWQDHPSLEHLAAYHEATIQGEERERIQAHLVECRACTRLLLDFASFDDGAPPPGIRELRDGEVDAAWGRMQELTPAPQMASVSVAHLPSSRTEEQPYRSHSVPSMLAAAGLAATVGLSIWGAWLHQELRQARKPELVETVPLDAQPAQTEERLERGVHRGVERGSRNIEGLSADRTHVLELRLPHHRLFSRFRFEILQVDGSEPLLSEEAPNVKLDFEGNASLTLRLPRKSLPPGTYTLRVSGLDGGSPEPVASYSVKVTP